MFCSAAAIARSDLSRSSATSACDFRLALCDSSCLSYSAFSCALRLSSFSSYSDLIALFKRSLTHSRMSHIRIPEAPTEVRMIVKRSTSEPSYSSDRETLHEAHLLRRTDSVRGGVADAFPRIE